MPQVEVARNGTVACLPERSCDHFGMTPFSDRFREFFHPLGKQLAARNAVFPHLLIACKFRTRELEIARETSVGIRHLFEQHMARRTWPGRPAGFLIRSCACPNSHFGSGKHFQSRTTGYSSHLSICCASPHKSQGQCRRGSSF